MGEPRNNENSTVIIIPILKEHLYNNNTDTDKTRSKYGAKQVPVTHYEEVATASQFLCDPPKRSYNRPSIASEGFG